MKSLLTWFALSFIAFVVLLGIGGLFLSKEYEVVRSISVEADQAKVHELVSNLDHWDDWGPWAQDNPELSIEPGPIRSGVGASQSWTDKTGRGRLVFTHCDPQAGVGYDLFFNDDEQKCLVELNYRTLQDGAVDVVWRIEGTVEVPVVGPYFARMMDSMLGPMFEDGLQRLKELAESS